jgi:DNA-directed RNA polymerase specialized sigma24 family protein
VLHLHVGLPLVEIAETLGIPPGTARSRLHYATRLLRSAIEADAAPLDNPINNQGRMA